MLNQLDTLIGFAVVMTVVSLLITIITQMISALLGLRGKNLADALGVMLYKIEPQLDKPLRQQLVQYILTRPMLSDSTMSMSPKWYDRVPLLSWFRGRWKLASAIRPEEVLESLNQIADVTADEAADRVKSLAAKPIELVNYLQGPTEFTIDTSKPAIAAAISQVQRLATTANSAVTAAAAAQQDKGLQAAAAQAMTDMLNEASKVNPVRIAALKTLAALHAPTAASKAAINTLTAQLPTLTAPTEAQAQALIARLKDASNIALPKLEKLFESAQGRAQQWFAMHTRFWTVLAAIAMAFVLQLDTFRVFTQISNDADLRAKLVNFSTDTLQKKADEVLTNSLSAGAINQEALRRLRSSTNITGITNLAATPADFNFANNSSVDDWLKTQASTNHWNETELLNVFHNLSQTVAKENYNRAGDQFADLTSTFSKTGFQLMPDPYPRVFAEGWKFWSPPWRWFSGEWSWPKRHLLGIIASAALLSLGAPFWFNLLKSMANLRPALANAVDKDQQAKTSKRLQTAGESTH